MVGHGCQCTDPDCRASRSPGGACHATPGGHARGMDTCAARGRGRSGEVPEHPGPGLVDARRPGRDCRDAGALRPAIAGQRLCAPVCQLRPGPGGAPAGQLPQRAAIPLAQEWRAYLAANPQPGNGEKASRAQDSNCKPTLGRSRPSDLEPDPRKCFDVYLAQNNRKWLIPLERFDIRWSPLQHVQWKHARYGLALPAYQESHLRRADRSRDDEWPRMSQLLAAASVGFSLPWPWCWCA